MWFKFSTFLPVAWELSFVRQVAWTYNHFSKQCGLLGGLGYKENLSWQQTPSLSTDVALQDERERYVWQMFHTIRDECPISSLLVFLPTFWNVIIHIHKILTCLICIIMSCSATNQKFKNLLEPQCPQVLQNRVGDKYPAKVSAKNWSEEVRVRHSISHKQQALKLV